MITNPGNLINLRLLISRRKNMILFSHLFPAQFCLIETAGGCSLQITSDQRIFTEHGEGFLRQQNLASGPFLNALQDFQITC